MKSRFVGLSNKIQHTDDLAYTKFIGVVAQTNIISCFIFVHSSSYVLLGDNVLGLCGRKTSCTGAQSRDQTDATPY